MCVQPIVDKLDLCGHAFSLSFELSCDIRFPSLSLLVRIVVVVVVVVVVDQLGDQRVGDCMCVQPLVDKLDLCGHVFPVV